MTAIREFLRLRRWGPTPAGRTGILTGPESNGQDPRRRMMHRSSIAVSGEICRQLHASQAIPPDSAQADGANIALCLDVSGSMYEEDGTGITRLKTDPGRRPLRDQELKPDVRSPSSPSAMTPRCCCRRRRFRHGAIEGINQIDLRRRSGGDLMDKDAARSRGVEGGPSKLSQILV